MERLTKRIDGYAHGAEGRSEDNLTGNWCRGEFEATAVVERLAYYEDLQKQGKLLKLDFKYQRLMIGQEIFVVEDNTVKSRKICKINEWWNDYQGFQGEYGAIPSKGFGAWKFEYGDFGKTVFLTKEEAGEALKRMEDGK